MNQAEKGRVVDLAAYRSHRGEQSRLKLPPDRAQAEELLNELGHYLLMAIRTITRSQH